MEEDPRSSEIVVVTIKDEEEEPKPPDEAAEESSYDVYNRAATEVHSDLDRFNKLKGLDKYSSDRQQQVGCSGFYKVPEDMRRRAGREEEAAALYDPKHVNLWKIRELFEKKDDPGDEVRTLSQMRHFDYHLRSYLKREGRGIYGIDNLMYQLWIHYEFGFSETGISGEQLMGSPVLWASIFLTDLFDSSLYGELSATEDPECTLLWVSELWADLLLLENQIPLVQGLYVTNIYAPVLLYFADYIPLNAKEVSEVTKQPYDYTFHHILELIHNLLLPTTSRSKPGIHPFAWFCIPKEAAPLPTIKPVPTANRLLQVEIKSKQVDDVDFTREELKLPRLHITKWTKKVFMKWFCIPKEAAPPSTMKPVPTATRLHQAGIKFKPVDDAGFVVEFKRGVLKLPRLHITKCTKKVLMNLIAWEICHTEAAKYFINYALFMDHLVNTSKDVEILVHSGVFEHSLATDDEVAAVFNGLSHDLVYTKNAIEDNKRYDIFPQLSFDINKHCKSRRNVWLANLMQDYFKSPWSIISLIAALLLILLTMEQTFFSAYSYFRPPK